MISDEARPTVALRCVIAVMQDFATLAHLNMSNMSITPSALYTPDQCPAHRNPRIHADHVDPEPLAPVA
jgi:hypothetical protein